MSTFSSPLLNNPVFFLLFVSFFHHPYALQSLSESKTMEQQAKQELEMLESLYPDRFQYLKLDLKSFISHDHLSEPSSFHSSMVDTQESTSLNQRKTKKKRTANEDYGDQHDECYWSVKKKKKKDRVDLVLERAEACLRKIRQFKASLLCSNS